jgi:hypothetical protein
VRDFVSRLSSPAAIVAVSGLAEVGYKFGLWRVGDFATGARA